VEDRGRTAIFSSVDTVFHNGGAQVHNAVRMVPIGDESRAPTPTRDRAETSSIVGTLIKRLAPASRLQSFGVELHQLCDRSLLRLRQWQRNDMLGHKPHLQFVAPE